MVRLEFEYDAEAKPSRSESHKHRVATIEIELYYIPYYYNLGENQNSLAQFEPTVKYVKDSQAKKDANQTELE